MDIATMVAINNLNMMTMMQAMQQRQNVITILSNGKEERIMEGIFDLVMQHMEELDYSTESLPKKKLRN